MRKQLPLNSRQQQIYQDLLQKGEVQTKVLTDHHQVAEMTIRRDLEKMESHGLLKRISGGAILAPNLDIGIVKRAHLHATEKELIGRKAAQSVRPGEAIYVDSGTTTPYLLQHLPPEIELTIVTNALNVASQIQDPNKEIILIGGLYQESSSSLVGPIAEQTLDQLSFDKAFLAASGVSLEQGFSNANTFELSIKQKVIQQSKENIFLINHEKFGQQFLYRITGFEEIDRIITEKEPPREFQAFLKNEGVDIVLC